jgi:hypothetical protein
MKANVYTAQELVEDVYLRLFLRNHNAPDRRSFVAICNAKS